MRTLQTTMTLFDLVRTIQDLTRTDGEVVAVVSHLMSSGKVVLNPKKGNWGLGAGG